MSLLKKLSVSLKTRDFKSTVFWAAYGTLRVHKFIIYTSISIPNDLPKNYSPRLTNIPLEKLEAYRIKTPNLPMEFFIDRIDKTNKCYVLYDRNIIKYIHWLYRCENKSRFFQLNKTQAEINNYTVLHNFRQKGVAVNALKQARHLHHGEGFSQILCAVHSDNVASHKSLIKSGFKPIKEFCHFGLYRPRVKITLQTS